MASLINFILNIPVARAQVAAAGEVANQTQDQLTQLVGTILSKIPLWITAFIVIILSFVIARIVKSSVENNLAEKGFEEEHKELSIVAGRSANAIVLTIGLTVGLKIAGIDLTTIIAAGAFGIGFALKDLIMNFIAGVMILTARHFTIGDIIKVNGVLGKIEEIQSRATVVKNFDGTKVVIPNAELFINPVTSYTSNPFRRVEVIVGVEYGTDLKLAMDCCLKAVRESKNVLAEPKPTVGLFEYGDSSINLKVKGWVESKKGIIKTKSSMIQNINKEFDAAGIGMPFPTRTIIFDEDIQRQKKEKMVDEQKVEKLLEEGEITQNPPPSQAVEPATAEAAPVAAPGTPAAEPSPVEASPAAVSTGSSNENIPDWLKNAAGQTSPQSVEQPAITPVSQTAEPVAIGPASQTTDPSAAGPAQQTASPETISPPLSQPATTQAAETSAQ